jgi:ubiquinone/menaquinone biosynthesis C-methylase UbiE
LKVGIWKDGYTDNAHENQQEAFRARGSCKDGAVDDGERAAAQYDAMGVAYDTDNRTGAFNAYYERPATISLLGNIDGKRVLEVGCGPGALTEWLVDHGALVTAIDISPVMEGIAKARLGDRARILVADLHDPLTAVSDSSADLVIASLVLHYLRDWSGVLREFRRILGRGGSVVFSTHHPAMDWQLHSPENYFAIKQVTEIWTKAGKEFDVTFWRRPLTAITEAIASAGFVIERLVEPEPIPDLKEKEPVAYKTLRTAPAFLFFRLSVASDTSRR